ncbi:MAG: hydrogenase maturation protease [Gammaproteobacteria bacterium]
MMRRRSGPREGGQLQRVICLGSAHGADALAWRLGEALEAALAGALPGVLISARDVEVVRCASPAQMAGALAGADGLVILDAVVQLPAGTLRVLAPEDLVDQRAHSSHGVGLVTVLELARVLGELPASVTVLGLGVGSPDADPRPLVALFLPEILRLLYPADGAP